MVATAAAADLLWYSLFLHCNTEIAAASLYMFGLRRKRMEREGNGAQDGLLPGMQKHRQQLQLQFQ